jgi:hypothetical protein
VKKKNFLKAILAALGRAALLISACFSGCGKGTPENQAGSVRTPTSRTIESAADMAKIGVGAWLMSDDYVLGIDIELSAWTPIGTKDNPFTGTFDGDGLTITVRGFSDDVLDRLNLGVFGVVSSAGEGTGVISNLNIEVYVAQYSTSTDHQNFGGLVGLATAGALLQNISASGSIRFAAENELYLGGIAGYLNGASLINAGSTPASSVAIIATASRAVYAGGAVGYGDGPEITGVTCSGDILISNGMVNTSAGGVSGHTAGTVITDCHASGNITIDFQRPAMVYAGGLAGYAGGGQITKSHATGVVKASADYPYAGGLVGYNYNGNQITKSYATGRVNAITNISGASFPYAGGLTGYNSGTNSLIQNCYATGYVYAQSGNITAWAGGITASNANNAVVDSCYATGAVEVRISRTVNPRAPRDGAVAGGIVGFNYSSAPVIRKSAALNPSIASTLNAAELHMGRVAGDSVSSASVPLDINIANQNMTFEPERVVVPGNNTTDGRNEAAQPAQNVYTGLGWDFTTVWIMGSGGYPVLRNVP